MPPPSYTTFSLSTAEPLPSAEPSPADDHGAEPSPADDPGANHVATSLIMERGKLVLRDRFRFWFICGTAGMFTLLWLFVTPLVLAINQDWTYAAAFYYTTQAGLGIGFGAMPLPRKAGLELLMVSQLVLGSALVAGIAGYMLSIIFAAAERRHRLATTNMSGRIEWLHVAPQPGAAEALLGDEGAPFQHLGSLFIGAVITACVLLTGVLYGVYSEHWSFTRSLLFVVSMCQTSGLQAPSVDASTGAWPAVFVAALALVGVPVWAYTIAAIASKIAHDRQQHWMLTEAIAREERAEAAYLRHRGRLEGEAREGGPAAMQLGSTAGTTSAMRHTATSGRLSSTHYGASTMPSAIDRSVFMELWMLRCGALSEEHLATIDHEYALLRDRHGAVTLEALSKRLRFLQLVALGLLKQSDWDVNHREYRQGTFRDLHLAALAGGRGSSAGNEPESDTSPLDHSTKP